MSSEYNNYASGAATSYATLGSYNAPFSMGVAPQGKVITGAYIVPQWGAIGYNSLQGKVPTGTGYGTISTAYGDAGGRCNTTFTTSVCGM